MDGRDLKKYHGLATLIYHKYKISDGIMGDIIRGPEGNIINGTLGDLVISDPKGKFVASYDSIGEVLIFPVDKTTEHLENLVRAVRLMGLATAETIPYKFLGKDESDARAKKLLEELALYIGAV